MFRVAKAGAAAASAKRKSPDVKADDESLLKKTGVVTAAAAALAAKLIRSHVKPSAKALLVDPSMEKMTFYKPGLGSSEVWKYGGVVLLNDEWFWVCIRCAARVGYNVVSKATSNMISHIDGTPCHCHCRSQCTDRCICCDATGHDLRKKASTKELTVWMASRPLAERALIQWLVEDNRPKATVSTKAFERFYDALAPKQKPPTEKTISEHITKYYDLAKAKLTAVLQPVRTACAVSTDGWLSPNNAEFMCAVVHYIDTNWELKHSLLQVLPMDGDTHADMIKQKLQSIFQSFQLKPHVIVCDQGRNYCCAVDQMFGVNRFICVAHNLNLVVCDVTRKTEFHPDPSESKAEDAGTRHFRCRRRFVAFR